MDVALVLRIVGLLISNAGAVPELVALFGEVKAALEGHAESGTVPTQAYLDDLVARAQAIAAAVRS